MSRILRFGLLGLVFALPLAIPQATQAAPRCVVPPRPCYTRPYNYGWYHYQYWHGQRHGHGHYRR